MKLSKKTYKKCKGAPKAAPMCKKEAREVVIEGSNPSDFSSNTSTSNPSKVIKNHSTLPICSFLQLKK